MADKKKLYSKIYDQYVGKLYRFIVLRVSSQEIAEDLCSETLLRGWETFKERSEEIENVGAFLYQIARNLVTDYYREKGKAKIVSAENIQITDPTPGLEEKTALISDFEQIKVALTNLREDYQDVIIWHYIDDLPILEIAKLQDKSEEATRVQLHRALKALKDEISQDKEVKEV